MKLDVLYLMVTNQIVTSLLIRNYDVSVFDDKFTIHFDLSTVLSVGGC